MIPGAFTYLKPSTLDEAIELLSTHADDGKILAGGQSLIPIMRFRLAEPDYLIDINHIAGLDGINENGDYLSIGALTREYQIDKSDFIRRRYPILIDTASTVADPLVRNLATVGGNLAHADPANDHPATMLTLRAKVVDPVCGMDVDVATARHVAEYEGQRFYFCCAGCRQSFEADPSRYLPVR